VCPSVGGFEVRRSGGRKVVIGGVVSGVESGGSRSVE